MSEMNRLDWWIDHLPLLLQDTTTENADALIARWQHLARKPGGLQSLAECGALYDKWLEVATDCTCSVEPYLFIEVVRLTVTTGHNAAVIQAIRTLLVGLKKWKHDLDSGPSGRELDNVAKRCYIDRVRNLSHCKVAPRLVSIARSILAEIFRDWDEVVLDTNPRTGPGSVFEEFSPLVKWQELASSYKGHHFSWLCSWNDADGLPIVWGDVCYERLLTARLCAVPKDAWKRRLITVEPNAHGFAQQLCRAAIIKCAEKCAVSAHLHLVGTRMGSDGRYDGQRSQQLRALMGSRGMSDNCQWSNQQWCTLDLTDASDYISVEQVDELFPDSVLKSLHACRSFYIGDRVSKGPCVNRKAPGGTSGDVYEKHVQRSYAGMGNATTFCVQTLVFWVMLESLRRYMGLPGQVHVFGDDIIIQANLVHHADALGLFASLGWKVNRNKSFYAPDGRFRESCGLQAYNGFSVTAVRFYGYDENDGLDCIALAEKIRQVADQWPSLAQRMLDTAVKVKNYRYAPKGSVDVDIWHLRRAPVPETPCIRWNRKLCKLEVLTWTSDTRTVCDWSAHIGYVFASILGTSLTRWRDVKRRHGGRVFKRRLPCYLASVPKQTYLVERWIPSTDWGRVDERV